MLKLPILLFLAHFGQFFKNISTQGGRTAKFHTVLESVHQDGGIDTHKDVKVKKKYFFVRRVPPFDFLAKKNCNFLNTGPIFRIYTFF